MLQEEIAAYSTKKHVILTGDFNARTGTLPDYVELDTGKYIPLPPEYTVDLPIPRSNCDSVVNNYGKELLDLCISSQLRVLSFQLRS